MRGAMQRATGRDGNVSSMSPGVFEPAKYSLNQCSRSEVAFALCGPVCAPMWKRLKVPAGGHS